jgi:hypothetical protein
MSVISGYNFHCNDVNGKFGTNQTATGIPISPTTYTAAMPMGEGRTPYKKGDIVLIHNTKNNKSALYQITDVGGLPHADIDIADGVGLKALGVDSTIGKGGGVIAVSQKDNFNIQRIGNVPLAYGDTATAQAVQNVLADINQGKKPMSALKELGSFKPSDTVKAEAFGQTLESYAPNIVPDVMNGGKKDFKYGEHDPDAPYRPKDQYMNYIQRMMQEEPLFGFMMMIVGMLTGQFTQQEFMNSAQAAPAAQNAARAVSPAEIQAGQQQVDAAQGPEAKGQAATDAAKAIAGNHPDAIKNLEQASTGSANVGGTFLDNLLKGIFSGIPGLEAAPVVDPNWHPPKLTPPVPSQPGPVNAPPQR